MNPALSYVVILAAETDLKVPESVSELSSKFPLPYLAGIVLGVLAVGLLFYFLRPRKKEVNPEEGLEVDLSSFPPLPGEPTHQLHVQGEPVRLRYVVIAPMGKREMGNELDSLLDQVFHGLGKVFRGDRPKVKVWPPQLSATGFAPTFFRLTLRAENPGKSSRWILLAGPARIGTSKVLVGLAVQSEEPTSHGQIPMTETRWSEIMRIEKC